MTEAEWLATTDPAPMLEELRGKVSDRKLRLFAVACCRHIWNDLADERSRETLEVIEGHSDGMADDERIAAAGAMSEAAFRSQKRTVFASIVGGEMADCAFLSAQGLFGLIDTETARQAHDAADGDPTCLAAAAVWSATSTARELADAGYTFIEMASNTASSASASQTDRSGHAAEQQEQATLLRCIFGNPFHPVTLDPAWLTPTAVAIATGIYQDRAFDRLPIFADALEDAGCDSAGVLAHCRSPGPHARGCWVVDLVLGKA